MGRQRLFIFMSRVNRPPLSLSKLASFMAGNEQLTAVLVGKVTDDVRLSVVPKLKICALGSCVHGDARASWPRAGRCSPLTSWRWLRPQARAPCCCGVPRATGRRSSTSAPRRACRTPAPSPTSSPRGASSRRRAAAVPAADSRCKHTHQHPEHATQARTGEANARFKGNATGLYDIEKLLRTSCLQQHSLRRRDTLSPRLCCALRLCRAGALLARGITWRAALCPPSLDAPLLCCATANALIRGDCCC